MSIWQKSPLVWRDGTIEYISIVFSWDIPVMESIIKQQSIGVEHRVVGGPAIMFSHKYRPKIGTFENGVAFVGNKPGVLQRYNPLATRTSQGCPNRCNFCFVNQIHPDFIEFDGFPVLPVVCDDNLLACSKRHFDLVIDRLKTLDWCDFNQGLDARALTQYQADRLAELKKPKIRLAWDRIKDEKHIVSAITKLRKAGIPRKNISCYVLIGFFDHPDDALYKLETLWHGFGIKPNPMRYQSNATRKNDYVSPHWTHKGLDRYMSYWANLRFTAGVPFTEYQHHGKIEIPFPPSVARKELVEKIKQDERKKDHFSKQIREISKNQSSYIKETIS